MKPNDDAGVRLEGALAHRMDQLEREYRRVKRLNLSLLVVLAIILGLGVALVSVSSRYGVPGTVADVVAARQFVLRGDDGSVRGLWGTADDGTLRLMLQDSTGRPRAKLDLLADGATGLTFADSAGKPRAVFAFMPDQTGSLVLADGAGRTRAVLGLAADGSPTILFADRGGNTRAGLGVDTRGAGTFTLVDRSGRDLAQPEPDPGPEPGETLQAPAPDTRR